MLYIILIVITIMLTKNDLIKSFKKDEVEDSDNYKKYMRMRSTCTRSHKIY